MTKTKSQQIKTQVLTAFQDLKLQLQQHNGQNQFQYILPILDTGIEKVSTDQQVPELEALAVYHTISTQLFVDQLRLNQSEQLSFIAIEKLAHANKGRNMLNLLNVTNLWPSN
ncbi:PbsX family transcriptional regulator [Pediococcus siamensis]|uniref:PbsX family transcriptional regulator n=1 Tax=Pediococcus siamensis TaxID=381829 RepID=UPI0039A29795